MSGPKHTPAPWKVGGDGPALWVEGPDPDRNVICDIVGRQENGEYDAGLTNEDEANAILIAAAPRLAAALNDLLDALPSATTHPAIAEAHAALREAGVES